MEIDWSRAKLDLGPLTLEDAWPTSAGGKFVPGDHEPFFTPGGHKVIVRGRYTDKNGNATDAVAKLFETISTPAFDAEVKIAALAQATNVAFGVIPFGRVDGAIELFEEEWVGYVEEYGGDDLTHVQLSPEQSRKVIFDLLCELHAMHGLAQYSHGDIKRKNLTVRRVGDSPMDIRAVLIDYESAQPISSVTVLRETTGLTGILFDELCGYRRELAPWQRDLVLAAALALELETGKGLAQLYDELEPDELRHRLSCVLKTDGIVPLVSYIEQDGGTWTIRARHIDAKTDLHPMAAELDLNVNPASTRHGGVSDAIDEMRWPLLSDASSYVEAHSDLLARSIHNDYLSVAGEDEQRAQRSFDELPMALKTSNYERALAFSNQLSMLGLKLSAGGGAEYHLAESDIEILAQLEHQRWMSAKLGCGYQYKDGLRCDEAPNLYNPYLLDWNDLSAEQQDENIRMVRGMIEIAQNCGISITQ